jgi:hypothetical protein
MNADEATAVLASMRRDAPAMSPTFSAAWHDLMLEVEKLADPKRPRDAEYDAHVFESVNGLSQFIGKPELDAAQMVPEPEYRAPAPEYRPPKPEYRAPDQAGGATAGTYVAQALLAAVILAGSVFSSIT